MASETPTKIHYLDYEANDSDAVEAENAIVALMQKVGKPNLDQITMQDVVNAVAPLATSIGKALFLGSVISAISYNPMATMSLYEQAFPTEDLGQ